MSFYFITFVLSLSSVVLLLLANIGTTFSTPVLDKLYLVEIIQSVTGKSIRYGVYSSCLYDNNVIQSCTPKEFAYLFDATQFAIACGADSKNHTIAFEYSNIVSSSDFGTLFKFIVLIMPSSILAFVSFCFTLFLSKGKKNNCLLLLGVFTSLLSFLIGAAGLVLVISTFWKSLDILEARIKGLDHQWGPSIYFVGVGVGCILGTFICFVISIFRKPHNRDTFNLIDCSSSTHDKEAQGQDSYTDAKTSQYPSYHQSQAYPANTYHQTDVYHHDTSTTQSKYTQNPHEYEYKKPYYDQKNSYYV